MYDDLKLFNELAEKCGNRYLAAKYIAAVARKYGRKSEGIILESKLLTWALTGVCPFSEEELELRRKNDSDRIKLEDCLCYVDDSEVADQVRKYYLESLYNRHLTLDCSGTLDKYREMRTNILLRMIWYGID